MIMIIMILITICLLNLDWQLQNNLRWKNSSYNIRIEKLSVKYKGVLRTVSVKKTLTNIHFTFAGRMSYFFSEPKRWTSNIAEVSCTSILGRIQQIIQLKKGGRSLNCPRTPSLNPPRLWQQRRQKRLQQLPDGNNNGNGNNNVIVNDSDKDNDIISNKGKCDSNYNGKTNGGRGKGRREPQHQGQTITITKTTTRTTAGRSTAFPVVRCLAWLKLPGED